MSETSSQIRRIVAALEHAWSEIQRRHTEVPDVVVTVGMGSMSNALRLGHFAPHRWHRSDDDPGAHELFIGGEGIKRGALDVMGTLLHEAAHGLAVVRGIKDTSRDGRYHNKRYKVIAEELGLTAVERAKSGYDGTSVPDKTQIEYVEVIFALEAELTLWRQNEFEIDLSGLGGENGASDTVKVPKPDPKPVAKIKIMCDCERTMRMARDVLAAGPVLCGLCGSEFTTRVIEEAA